MRGTHHSEVIIHWLEGAAEQLAGFWVSDFANASTILCVPDPQSPVQWRRHDDVIAQRPGKVRDGPAVTFQGQLHTWRRGRQRHDGQGTIQWAASE